MSGGKAEWVKRVSDEVIINGSLAWTPVASLTNIYKSSVTSWATGKNVYALSSDKANGTAMAKDGHYLITNDQGIDQRQVAIYMSSNKNLYVSIEKTKVDAMAGATTLDKFKAYLNQYPITLTYQLATPIITPIEVSGNLVSYPSGTVYIERVIADAGLYNNGITTQYTTLPIKSIDKIIKYNFATGVQTSLDVSKAVINANKLSFTHPDLVNGDMVFFDYFYDVESTEAETEIEYFDSRHTIKDTNNNKFYSWKISSTNGVASVALTEVL